MDHSGSASPRPSFRGSAQGNRLRPNASEPAVVSCASCAAALCTALSAAMSIQAIRASGHAPARFSWRWLRSLGSSWSRAAARRRPATRTRASSRGRSATSTPSAARRSASFRGRRPTASKIAVRTPGAPTNEGRAPRTGTAARAFAKTGRVSATDRPAAAPAPRARRAPRAAAATASRTPASHHRATTPAATATAMAPPAPSRTTAAPGSASPTRLGGAFASARLRVVVAAAAARTAARAGPTAGAAPIAAPGSAPPRRRRGSAADRMTRAEAWFLYIARCADRSLYTGIARDVDARIAQHDAGKGARYTRGRGPLHVCAVRRCASKGEALRLELAVKRLPRASKEELCRPRRLAAFARRVQASQAVALGAKRRPLRRDA